MSRDDSNPAPGHGRPVRQAATLGPHGGRVGRFAWSPSGRLIAAPDETGAILLWDVATGRRLRELLGHTREVYAVAFDASGRTLASVGQRGALILWDVQSGALKQEVQGPRRNDVAFAPTGRLLATAEDDNRARLWSVDPARLWTVGEGVELLRELDAHTGLVMCIAFDSPGTLLATGSVDRSIKLWDVARGELVGSLEDHDQRVLSVAFDPRGGLASAGDDQTIKLWDPRARRLVRTLEGHTSGIRALSFSADGKLLASGSTDGSVWLWETATGKPVATVSGGSSGHWMPGLAFHPSLRRLARVATQGGLHEDNVIDILDLDLDALLDEPRLESITYTSAKIVLVGDSGVGKTGLGWRLVHGNYIEHASTHGQQFWLLDQLGTTRADGAQCEAVLWDLAGQPDYRLIHALFLDDADIALLLFDPTRDDDPLHGVDYWIRQLGVTPSVGALASSAGRPAILVAARSDRGDGRLTAQEIESFCAQRGLRAFVTTSAVTGAGLEQLIAEMRDTIAWDERATTVTTETFKQIKDYVLGLKERANGECVILSPDELHARLQRDDVAIGFSADELSSAVGHLTNHGYVCPLSTSKGEARILLAPELLNNVASSIVLEARRNPKGLGSLEEQRVLSGDYGFPELAALAPSDRDVLLDSAVATFLDHSLCFRETDPLSSRVYIVFPELINLKKRTADDEQPVEDGVAYTAIGAVENLYASLVVLLGYTSTFTRTNQWRDHARYVVGDGMVCGFRLEAEREGELDFVLYFGTTVGAPIRTLFQSLFESFLARRNLTIRRYEAVICPNGHRLNRAAVREQVADGNTHGFCTRCGKRVSLPSGDTPIVLTKEQAAVLSDERREIAQRSRFEQEIFRLKAYLTQQDVLPPSCFVSYAWGDGEQERWVEMLANDLVKAGVVVVLDRWENARIGASISRFIERITSCDHVIVVGTPSYRTKYDNGEPMRGFVVAAEGDLIGTRMLGTEQDKRAVLPALLQGTKEQSLPPLLHSRMFADFRDPDQYFAQILTLVFSLYDIPPQRRTLRRTEPLN